MDRRILVVDDSELICQQLSQLLSHPDRQITIATDGTAAMEWLVEHPCSLVLTDLQLPGISGLDLIQQIRDRELPVTVIVMTGFATVESAVEAMKLGAYDLIQKPLDTIRLEMLVNQALEDRRLIDEVADLRCRLQKKYAYHNLLGRSPRMAEVFERVARVASSSCNVLVTGETGTGKELVAQAIHFSDVTRRGALVTVNCAALPEPLLESELFGHERGDSIQCLDAMKRRSGSSWRMAVPSSWTRSARCLWVCRRKLLQRPAVMDSSTSARGQHGNRVDPDELPGPSPKSRPTSTSPKCVAANRIPRRPVLSAQRFLDRNAAAPRAAGRYPPPCRPFPRQAGRTQPAQEDVLTAGDFAAPELRLARQCARAGTCDRTGNRHHARHGH